MNQVIRDNHTSGTVKQRFTNNLLLIKRCISSFCVYVSFYGSSDLHIVYCSSLDRASLLQMAIQILWLLLRVNCHIVELRLIDKNAFDLHSDHSLHLSPSHRHRHHLRLSTLASHQVAVLCRFNCLLRTLRLLTLHHVELCALATLC
ncbi:hypothetical protein EDC96DRAFT_545539 [Choanephora cucurbitarum]|nr:hypothetical protein EDC96DRAFT_545539 [Choanephora cucurbitarum]